MLLIALINLVAVGGINASLFNVSITMIDHCHAHTHFGPHFSSDSLPFEVN
jgi:hypothetical protein